MELKAKVDSLTDSISDYIETYVKLAVVNTTQKASSVASVSLMAILLVFFFLFVMIFMGIGISIWVGEAMNDPKAGYFIVGGFYLLLGLIIVVTRKTILFPFVRNTIIRKVYEDHRDI